MSERDQIGRMFGRLLDTFDDEQLGLFEAVLVKIRRKRERWQEEDGRAPEFSGHTTKPDGTGGGTRSLSPEVAAVVQASLAEHRARKRTRRSTPSARASTRRTSSR